MWTEGYLGGTYTGTALTLSRPAETANPKLPRVRNDILHSAPQTLPASSCFVLAVTAPHTRSHPSCRFTSTGADGPCLQAEGGQWGRTQGLRPRPGSAPPAWEWGLPAAALQQGRGRSGRAAALLITAAGTAEGRAAGGMQGNGEKAAGNGRQEGLGGRGAADGELQAAAVPMLPALEVAEEPEKAPGGKSKDPNTYKVLSLVRAGRARRAAPPRYAGGRAAPAVHPEGRERLVLAGPSEPPGKPSAGLCQSNRGAAGSPRPQAAVRRLRWRA